MFYVGINGTWTKVQDLSTKNTFSWTPNTPGNYTIRVRYKHKNSSNSTDGFKDLSFIVKEAIY